MLWGFLTESDLPECVALGSHTFGLGKNSLEDWVQRRLFRNPYQANVHGFGIGAREKIGGTLVAYRMMLGQPWWLDSEPVMIAFAAHTAVASHLRGMGVGKELTRRSAMCAYITGSSSSGIVTQNIYKKAGFYAIGEDNDFFRYRISFRNSFKKRIGYLGDSIGCLIDRLLRSPSRQEASPCTFSLVTRCDERFDQLWSDARKGYGSCLERSSSYLNWRIFDEPTCPLWLGALHEKGTGRLRAYAVWHVQAFDKYIRMAVLRDLFSLRDDDTAREALIDRLLGYWHESGISWASFEIAHPVITSLFRRLGFEHVPSKGSRYHINPASRELGARFRHDWFRSGLDGDYLDVDRPEFIRPEGEKIA